MTFNLKEQFDSGKECKVFSDLRLVKRENGGTIIVVDLYFSDTLRGNVPGLFLRHDMRKDVARAIGNAKPQNILEIVLNRVPAWRPRRQAQPNPRLIDVLDEGSYTKLFRARICKTDGVVDFERRSLRISALCQNEQEKEREG